jgi:hypothetical protein
VLTAFLAANDTLALCEEVISPYYIKSLEGSTFFAMLAFFIDMDLFAQNDLNRYSIIFVLRLELISAEFGGSANMC